MVREEGGGWPKNDLLHTKLHATLHVLFFVGAATWANVVAFAAHFHNIRQHMLAITYAMGGHCIGLANWLQLCFGFNSNAHFGAWRWPGLLLHKVLLLSGPAREKDRESIAQTLLLPNFFTESSKNCRANQTEEQNLRHLRSLWHVSPLTTVAKFSRFPLPSSPFSVWFVCSF